QRKNGLFKKAHELGVLCSVDVAVIIFDERHGHDTKLFQYSSCDVRDIVQRHLRVSRDPWF
ncbi:Transcription factor SMP1, partial [Termitomyces sp. J132]